VLPRDAVEQNLGIFASIMRGAFSALRREHGEEAYKIMSDALDEAEAIFERGMGPQTPEGSDA
jgi:hypothetical protein